MVDFLACHEQGLFSGLCIDCEQGVYSRFDAHVSPPLYAIEVLGIPVSLSAGDQVFQCRFLLFLCHNVCYQKSGQHQQCHSHPFTDYLHAHYAHCLYRFFSLFLFSIFPVSRLEFPSRSELSVSSLPAFPVERFPFSVFILMEFVRFPISRSVIPRFGVTRSA